MRLVNQVSAYVIEFERFDDFYYQPQNGFTEDKRVNFGSLDMYLVPEESTRVAAVRAGEADIAPASLAAREQVEAGGGRLIFGQEGSWVEVRLHGCHDPNNPLCRDKRIRQALDYAIDKELLRDKLYGGPEVFQVKGWGVVTPSTFGYTPDLDPRPFDPAKARQLLADAGHADGNDIGKLIVNTNPSSAIPFQVEGAQLAADFWRKELGLDVEVRVSDSTSIKDRRRAGELDGQIIWWDNETRIDAYSNLLSNYGDPEHSQALHMDMELHRTVQETVGILDPRDRERASEQLIMDLREETYQIGVGYVNIPWAVGPRILTWSPYSLSLHPSALHTITLE